MSIDALTFTAIISELKPKIVGGKINKIMQPNKEELHLLIYNNGKLLKLLISANPSSSRMHLTSFNKENPLTAPHFCMLLRKHLTGGEIVDIANTPYDRIVTITMSNITELKDKTYKKLHIELLGRQSNIILCEQDETIILPLKTVSFDMTSKRAAMAGLKYIPLESESKFAITDSSRFLDFIKSFEGGNLISYITAGIMGFGKETVRYILNSALGNKIPDLKLDEDQALAVANAFFEYDKNINELNISPCITLLNNEYTGFYTFSDAAPSGLDVKNFDTINQCVDEFYSRHDIAGLLKDKSKLAANVIKNTKNKMTKKIALISEKLSECENMDHYKKMGELLTSYIYMVKPKMAAISVADYYDDNKEINIPLQENLTPSQNAQRYFKLYNKLKTAKTMSNEQLSEAKLLLSYILSVEQFLSQAKTAEEVEEINEELKQAGLLKKQIVKGKKVKEYKPNILTFEVDGHKILCGKNNLQNDYLTFKVAKPDDIWLHAKDNHGSHVVVQAVNKKISDKALYEAAKIAALNSQGKTADKVAVDYTPKKFIKKPNGSKPGFVVYNDYKSIMVDLS